MDVILHYDSGFPTRLKKHSRLAQMIRQSGPPVVDGWRLVWVHTVGRFAASWDYFLNNPWPGDKRKLVKVEAEFYT